MPTTAQPDIGNCRSLVSAAPAADSGRRITNQRPTIAYNVTHSKQSTCRRLITAHIHTHMIVLHWFAAHTYCCSTPLHTSAGDTEQNHPNIRMSAHLPADLMSHGLLHGLNLFCRSINQLLSDELPQIIRCDRINSSANMSLQTCLCKRLSAQLCATSDRFIQTALSRQQRLNTKRQLCS